MNRKDITKMLGRTLIQSKFSGMGKYWASEVSIDPFTATGKGGRVDFMQFIRKSIFDQWIRKRDICLLRDQELQRGCF